MYTDEEYIIQLNNGWLLESEDTEAVLLCKCKHNKDISS